MSYHIPNKNAPSAELLAYANWLDSNEIAHCYMMTSMNSVLQKQHEGYKTTREIIDNAEDMFGGQSLLVRQAALYNLINCKHKPGTPIKDHMLTVIEYLAEPKTMDLRSMVIPR